MPLNMAKINDGVICYLLFVLWLQYSCILTAKVEKCDDNTTLTTRGKAYWKYRGIRYTTSEDILCWKESGEIFVRECNIRTGQWEPESVRCKVHEETNKYCPEDLVEISDDNGDLLCLKISTKPQRYTEDFCYGSNRIVPLDISVQKISSFIDFLGDHNLQQYWLPLRRDNASMPYMIRLPGRRWKQLLDDNPKITDLRSEKTCLSAQISKSEKKSKSNNKKYELNIITTNCEDLLYSICVFQGNLIASSGCPEGSGALSYRPNECFGVNGNTDNKELNDFTIKEYFEKRNALRHVFEKFPPKEQDIDYFGVENFLDKDGNKYLIVMNQNEMVKIVEENVNKPIAVLKRDILNYEQVNTVKLILKIDVNLQELILVVYNPQYIWRINEKDIGVKCFTNADYDLLQSTKIDLLWENEQKTKSIFKLKLVGDDPGEYWCDAHTISNFHLVTSEKIVAAKKIRGHAFAIKINASCVLEDGKKFTNICNSIYKDSKTLAKHLQTVLRKLSKELSQNLVIHSIRIMSIDQIFSKFIDCWIHLTASLKNSAIDNSEEESSEEDNSLENDDQIRHDTLIRMQVWSLLRELMFIYNPNVSTVVRSTEYCFPTIHNLYDNKKYQWKQATRGQVATLSRLCFQSNGMPYTRLCQGDFLHGAHWETVKENLTCQLEEENSKITETLYSLAQSNLLQISPEIVVRKVKNLLQENAKQFLPVDIHFSANILQTSVRNLDQYVLGTSTNMITAEYSRNQTLFKETTRDIMSIYNYLVDVKDSAIKMSAQLNSTNKLLEVFENSLNTLSTQTIIVGNSQNKSDTHGLSDELESNIDFEVLDYEDIGVTVKVSPNLLFFIINPSIANISGIALFQNNNNTELPYELKGAFENEYYQFLQSNHEIEDFVNEPNLQFGTYVPEKLLIHLDTISNTLNSTTRKVDTIVVIKVYSNDKLFQPHDSQKNETALGRVVSISLPGHSTHLPIDLPLVFRIWQNNTFNHNNVTELCSYWNFKNWASDGIQVLNQSDINEEIIICQVSHLTPFAYLVGFNFTVEDVEVNIRHDHVQALDIITVTGCSFSLLGICGIFITAAIFHSWRQKPSSKVLLQLSAAIALQMIILCFVNTQEYSLHLIVNKIVPSCVAIGAFLQYTVLVQFFWMMVIAYLQFKRYVQVFGQSRPNRFFLKSTIFCWGLPIIPVILVILFDHDSFTKGTICYPSGYALYFGVILPTSIIFIANFVIFCLIIYNILVSSNPPIRHTDKPVFIYQIRLSVLLFFLLGFTWCFGFLSTMKAGIVFSYLFCLTATLQGFVIFVYFIILDPVTRRMWTQYFYSLCSIDKSSLNSTVSFKDTTQSY